MAWYKDAALLHLEKLSRFQLLEDGSLQISGLVPDDTGMFQCFARNAAGEVQTTTYLAVTSRCQPPLPWGCPVWVVGEMCPWMSPTGGSGTPGNSSGSGPGWAQGGNSGGAVHLCAPQASPPTSRGVPRTAR